MYKQLLPFFTVASLAAGSLFPGPAAAQSANNIFLEDSNSSFFWNFEELSFEDDWLVENVDSLFSKKAFFRFGNSSQPESSFDSFELTGIEQSAANQATASFLGFDSQLQIDISITLNGGVEGSGQSWLSESYTFTNRSSQSQELSFFQYWDFDIGGADSFNNDTTMVMGSQLIQFDGEPSDQNDCIGKSLSSSDCDQPGAPSNSAEYVIVTADQMPDRFEVESYPELLAKFFDNSPTELDSQKNVLINGDATAAFQFGRQLAGNQSTSFGFTKFLQVSPSQPNQTVPEPALGLVMVGLGGYLTMLRRRSPKSNHRKG